MLDNKDFAMNSRLVLIASFFSLLVASPAAMTRDRDYSARLALVTQFAGEPVMFVRFGLPKLAYDWEPLGDTAVLVWHTRSKAYLVDLEKSTSCSDLDREISIRLDNNVNDLDSRNGYFELLDGRWCKMIKIRPVDVTGLRKAKKLKRESS